MKILLLCNKVPFPANDGSTIAIASIIDSLILSKVQVSVLAFNTSKHFRTNEEISSNAPAGVELRYIYLDNRIDPLNALINLLSSRAYQVSRFRNKHFRQALIQELSEHEYDIIQIEGLSMAVYLPEIRKYSTARVVLRAHNVEAIIWKRHLQSEKNPFFRLYLALQNRRLAAFERKVAYEVDAIVAITPEDLAEFRRLQPAKVAISIPCGVDLSKYEPCLADTYSYDLCYIASFDWLPNQQGIRWFLDEVWPLVLAKRSNTTFALAGRHMPQDIAQRAVKGLKVEGEVLSMKDFLCSGRLVVVPLLAGSGMRIKILENMALGLCQVTTQIGAEGFDIENGVNIVIADDPSEMATAIIKLLNQPEKILQIGKNARQMVGENFSNKWLGKQLVEFYEDEVC